MTEHRGHVSPDRWEALWAAERPPHNPRVRDLRAEAARRRRTMALVVLGEVALTIGLIALTLVLLRAEGPIRPDRMLWLLFVWLTWCVAAGFAVWNRRGVWAPEAEAARGYLALSEERAHRRRRVAWFVLGLTVAQVVAVLIAGVVTLPGLVVAGLYAGWAGWYGRRAHRDLEEVRRIAAEFRDEGQM